MALLVIRCLNHALSEFTEAVCRFSSLHIDEVVRECLSQFPYSPPCMLTALLCAVSAILALLLLPETLATRK